MTVPFFIEVPAARAQRWANGKRTVAHPWRCVTIPILPWYRLSRRSARASRRRREEVATADFAEEDDFVSMVEEAGVATGGVESAALLAGSPEAADEHRATVGGLMVCQATGKGILVGQKNACLQSEHPPRGFLLWMPVSMNSAFSRLRAPLFSPIIDLTILRVRHL